MLYTWPEDAELELLLNLEGASYEAAAGYVVEFSAKRVPRRTSRQKSSSNWAGVVKA
jgi:hypothetical protein